jgi:hypothetical protein
MRMSMALPNSATAARASPFSSYTWAKSSRNGTQRGPAAKYSRNKDSASQKSCRPIASLARDSNACRAVARLPSRDAVWQSRRASVL